MASLKKIKRDLAKLGDEELKDVLDFLTDDDEEEEQKEQQEVKDKVEVIEEVKKEEPKQEVKDEPKPVTKEDLEELVKMISENFALKEEVEKVTKKAKPFGGDPKNPKEDKKDAPSIDDYLAKLNSQFV